MENVIEDRIKRLCEKTPETSGLGNPVSIESMGISGSQRKYFRVVFPGFSVVACLSSNTRENETFLNLSNFLLKENIKVPIIYGIDESCSLYLLEDLGDTDLFALINENPDNKPWNEIRTSISQLVGFQRLPKKEWEKIVEFPALDSNLIQYDFNYAVQNLFIPLDINYDENGLKDDFKRLECKLLSYPFNLWGLMYRDFQSRNIMIFKGRPYFIDYQSCRLGPGIYDIVSFAWQAKARFNPSERNEIVLLYIDELKKIIGAEGLKQVVMDNVPHWGAFRIIQTLGAYGLRGLKEGKPHFIESLPPAVGNLNYIMDCMGLSSDYPELNRVVKSLVSFF